MFPKGVGEKSLSPAPLFLFLSGLLWLMTMYDFGKLSIACINCNSLNMSNSAKWNQTLKVCGITKIKSDIIFLSDTRLSNKNLVSAEDDIKYSFLHNPYGRYNAVFNSTKNKRGVGILIKYELQIELLDTRKTDDENFLLLHLRIAPGRGNGVSTGGDVGTGTGTELVLICIYGPNSNDPVFFDNIKMHLEDFKNIPVIMGGDWNCTFSTDPIETNIDCLNMSRAPNISHSKKLAELCTQYELSDPYRLTNSEKLEFTFVPRSALARNKSRIDFFLISEVLLNFVSKCEIADSLQNKLFDHKAVHLIFNEKKPSGILRPTISNKDLDDDLLEFVLITSAVETYIIHCDEPVIAGRNRNFLLNTCGMIKKMIKDCGPPLELRVGCEQDPARAPASRYFY
jgi:exonuclease III